MADPILQFGARAQVIFPGWTGFPEDRFVNTFAFRKGSLALSDPDSDDWAKIVADLIEFYNTPTTTGGSVCGLIGSHVNRPQCAIRVYDLSVPPPREPIEAIFTLGAQSGTTSMPAEVAVTMSFYSFVNQPRSRGRIFLGPLSVSAIESTPSATIPDVRVSNSARAILAAAATRLANKGLGIPDATPDNAAGGAWVRWCVLSQSDAALRVVTDGWVDNALDTQRRRGMDATVRTGWTSVLGELA